MKLKSFLNGLPATFEVWPDQHHFHTVRWVFLCISTSKMHAVN